MPYKDAMQMKIEYLDTYDPTWERLHYKHPGDAGFDLRAAIAEPITLKPGQYLAIPTGVKMELVVGPLPPHVNYEIQIRARSGLAAKHGVTVLNGVGTIDLGYRGEYRAILVNHGAEDFVINPGERIAQAVVAPVMRVDIETVDRVSDDTSRSVGGLGSTGSQ